MTRYVESFSWTGTIEKFLAVNVPEKPLLNVCSGKEKFGDVTCDLYEPSDIKADWKKIPVADNSFAAVFADPPWNAGYKKDVAEFVMEALRIAPVAYLMAPWMYGSAKANLSRVWVRQFPGVNVPILITRYTRP